jgi:hypothetical protein
MGVDYGVLAPALQKQSSILPKQLKEGWAPFQKRPNQQITFLYRNIPSGV